MTTTTDINKQLVNVAYSKHDKYDWGWHQLQVVRGCWFAWEDRNGTTHRIEGFDKQNLLERIKAL